MFRFRVSKGTGDIWLRDGIPLYATTHACVHACMHACFVVLSVCIRQHNHSHGHIHSPHYNHIHKSSLPPHARSMDHVSQCATSRQTRHYANVVGFPRQKHHPNNDRHQTILPRSGIPTRETPFVPVGCPRHRPVLLPMVCKHSLFFNTVFHTPPSLSEDVVSCLASTDKESV